MIRLPAGNRIHNPVCVWISDQRGSTKLPKRRNTEQFSLSSRRKTISLRTYMSFSRQCLAIRTWLPMLIYGKNTCFHGFFSPWYHLKALFGLVIFGFSVWNTVDTPAKELSIKLVFHINLVQIKKSEIFMQKKKIHLLNCIGLLIYNRHLKIW